LKSLLTEIIGVFKDKEHPDKERKIAPWLLDNFTLSGLLSCDFSEKGKLYGRSKCFLSVA